MKKKIFCVQLLLIPIMLLPLFINGCRRRSTEKADPSDVVEGKEILKFTGDTCLVYYNKTTNGYVCSLRNLENGDTACIAEFSSKPLEALWDTAEKSVFFFLESGLFKYRYDSIGHGIKMADLPDTAIIPDEAWIDSTENSIRFSYLVSEENFTDTQKSHYQELSNKQGGILPDYGSSCLVKVVEFNTDGSFGILYQEAAKYGGGYLMPFLKTGKLKQRKSEIISNKAMMFFSSSATILQQGRALYVPSKEYAHFGLDKNKKFEEDEIFKIIADNPYTLLVSSTSGEYLHFAPPFMVYDKKNNTITELKAVSNSQVAIFILGDYILFGDEYSNSDFKVFNWKKQKLIISVKEGSGGFIAVL